MTDNALKRNVLIAQIYKLPYELQLRVFDYVRSLIPKGTKGKTLLKFEGAIAKPDLEKMAKSIKEECEKVDNNE
ncbi:MAG: hypothetical protein HZA48_02605 [Planctomycetes bacterium]|nr:hypothetical protein [Planctomycetota bacterium]